MNSLTKHKKKLNIKDLIELTRNIKFFQELTEKEHSDELHQACCAVMKLRNYEADQNIIKYGTIGKEFFVLLSGTVIVSIPVKAPKLISRRDLEKFGYSNENLRRPLDELVEREVTEMQVVSRLEEGASFGELALINDKPRSATITAATAVVTAILDKYNFKKIISSYEEKKLHEAYSFFSAIPIFSGFTRESLHKLTCMATSMVFSRKNVLFKEGQRADSIYFVKEGEVKLCKNIVVETRPLVKPSNRFSQELGNASIVKRVRFVDLCIKGAYEILGLEELVEKSNSRRYSCICVSTKCEVIVLKYTAFSMNIQRSEVWKYLAQKSNGDHIRNLQRVESRSKVENSKKDLKIMVPSVVPSRVSPPAMTAAKGNTQDLSPEQSLNRSSITLSKVNRMNENRLYSKLKGAVKGVHFSRINSRTSSQCKLNGPSPAPFHVMAPKQRVLYRSKSTISY